MRSLLLLFPSLALAIEIGGGLGVNLPMGGLGIYHTYAPSLFLYSSLNRPIGSLIIGFEQWTLAGRYPGYQSSGMMFSLSFGHKIFKGIRGEIGGGPNIITRRRKEMREKGYASGIEIGLSFSQVKKRTKFRVGLYNFILLDKKSTASIISIKAGLGYGE